MQRKLLVRCLSGLKIANDNSGETITGNTLEGDVSDVFALDQPTSLFCLRKATRMSP